jgi:hypothetical protein
MAGMECSEKTGVWVRRKEAGVVGPLAMTYTEVANTYPCLSSWQVHPAFTLSHWVHGMRPSI